MRIVPAGMGRLPVAAIFAFATVSAPVQAETLAGTPIVNTAGLRYDLAGVEQVVTSNTDTRIVAERLDVALSRIGSGPVAATADAIPVVLTNRGNGMEAFRLSASDDRGAPPTMFAIDVDGDGRFDATRDTLLADAVTPVLAPGATLPLLLVDGAQSPLDGSVITIVARAVTGFGEPGTDFPGRGDGGGDAVVGPTRAEAQVSVQMAGEEASPGLSKTQSVRAPDGSARAIRGAVITYTLSAVFPSAAQGARIDDPVPAGSRYVPGSLLLDGVPLSDAADGDAGQADDNSVGATLGTVPAATVRTLQFQVRIQ